MKKMCLVLGLVLLIAACRQPLAPMNVTNVTPANITPANLTPENVTATNVTPVPVNVTPANESVTLKPATIIATIRPAQITGDISFLELRVGSMRVHRANDTEYYGWERLMRDAVRFNVTGSSELLLGSINVSPGDFDMLRIEMEDEGWLQFKGKNASKIEWLEDDFRLNVSLTLGEGDNAVIRIQWLPDYKKKFDTYSFKPNLTVEVITNAKLELAEDNLTVKQIDGDKGASIIKTFTQLVPAKVLEDALEDCKEDCDDYCASRKTTCESDCQSKTSWGCEGGEDTCREYCDAIISPFTCRDACRESTVACQKTLAASCGTACNQTSASCVTDCQSGC